jgi:anti-sigma factor RsiW
MSGKNCMQEILISTYLDGELSGEALSHAEAHLTNCPDCRAIYDRMKSDRDFLLECMPEATPPAYIKQQLFRRMNAARAMSPHSGILAWAGIGRMFPLRSRAWIAACASVALFAVMLSVFQYQRRLEDNKILSAIDRSKAEWTTRDHSENPFNIDTSGVPLKRSLENPFNSYLNEH